MKTKFTDIRVDPMKGVARHMDEKALVSAHSSFLEARFILRRRPQTPETKSELYKNEVYAKVFLDEFLGRGESYGTYGEIAARSGFRYAVGDYLKNSWWCPDYIMRGAAEGGHRDIVELALEKKANKFNRAMWMAAKGGHRDIVELMLEKGATDYNTAMAAAAYEGHMDIVELMLEKGAYIYDGAMGCAADGGHMEIVKLMIEKGANNYNEATALAVERGHNEIVDLLREHQHMRVE